MTDFQQQAVRLAAAQNSPAWLAPLRQSAAEQWLSAAWPTRKTEAWQYTPLLPLQKVEFAGWSASARQVGDVDFIALDAVRLVFVDGVFNAALSGELPDNVVRFGNANEEQQTLITRFLGRIVDSERHVFSALSNAWVNDGVLIHLRANTHAPRPVYVVHISTPGVQPEVSNQRVLLVAERGATGTLIEHFVTDASSQNAFVNSLTEIDVGDNASVEHYRINLEQEDIIHIGGVHVDLGRAARLRAFTIAQGSRLKRLDYQINHRGEGAELDLQGIYLPRNQQLVDYHTNVQHMVPHCTSSEVFRGIIADSARAVFNGRIYIHPQAQKTLAELSNKNLLTSSKAEIDTKPELEIYADDVKCAHGATVSQLNATALYYLQSRGISRQEAEVMLSFGFINELLEQIREPAVRDYLMPRIARLFGRDDEFLQRIHHD